jgi:hypothetical protein
MVDHMEKRATSVSCIPSGIRGSYNVNLKLMLMNHSKITNSCNVAIKFQVSRETIRINTKSTQKCSSGHKHGQCQELEQEIVQFMYFKKEREREREREQCTNKKIEL